MLKQYILFPYINTKLIQAVLYRLSLEIFAQYIQR